MATNGDPAPSFSIDELSELVGAYYNVELDVTYTLSLAENKLMLQIRYETPTKVTLLDKDRGRATVGTLHFERDGTGSTTGFSLASGRVQGLHFVKQ